MTQDQIRLLDGFAFYLHEEERSKNTITKYIRDMQAFFAYLKGEKISKNALLKWKEYLCETYAPASVNSMLAAVNHFLDWAGHPEYKVKPIKIQRPIFSRQDKELTKKEYIRLVEAAENIKNRRLSLLLQTICATGIRVSEVCFISAEAVKTGRSVVDCKGKKRIILLPDRLSCALRCYCREEGIESGVVFRTKTGTPLDRSNIWRDMKALCRSAGVEPGKVFPHNLRHLFAKTYYQLEKDLSRLADLLGHSSVNTTRIYTMESGREHIKQLERMGMVLTWT